MRGAHCAVAISCRMQRISKSTAPAPRRSLHPPATKTRKHPVHRSARASAPRPRTSSSTEHQDRPSHRCHIQHDVSHTQFCRTSSNPPTRALQQLSLQSALRSAGRVFPSPTSRHPSEQLNDSAATAIDSAESAAAKPRRSEDPASNLGSTPRTVEPSGEESAAPREARYSCRLPAPIPRSWHRRETRLRRRAHPVLPSPPLPARWPNSRAHGSFRSRFQLFASRHPRLPRAPERAL